MKRKTIYLLALTLSAITVLYLSFGNEPQFHLWNWFGYKFGINLGMKNIIPKLILMITGAFYYFEAKKEQAYNQ